MPQLLLRLLVLHLLLISCSGNQENQATEAVDIIENFKNDGWTEYLQQDLVCSETDDFCFSKDENLELRIVSDTNGPDPEIAFVYGDIKFSELLVGHYFAFELKAFLFKDTKTSILIVDEVGEWTHTLLFYKLEKGEIKFIGEKELVGESNIMSIRIFIKENTLSAVIEAKFEGDEVKSEILVLDLSQSRNLNAAKVATNDTLEGRKIHTFNFSPQDADSMMIDVFSNEAGADDFEKESFGLSIKILKTGSNGFWRENHDLVFGNSNCFSEGFEGIATKGNYFTIEQQLCDRNLLMFSYMTFVYRDNEIFLHK